MSKKILSILLVLTMLVGVVAVMPLTASAAETFTIKSVSDWNTFAANAANYSNVILDVPGGVLDFGGTSPTKASGFGGTFDGNGQTISGVAMSATGTSDVDVGMFCSSKTVTIKNLVMKNSTFDGDKGKWVGALICCTSANTTIENVYIADSVTVKGGSYVGGFVGGCAGGTNKLTIKDSVFAGKVSLTGQYGGGFVGSGNSTNGKLHSIEIINCLMIGDVTTSRTSSPRTSGFIGYNYQKDAPELTNVLTNCINAGTGTNNYSRFADAGNMTVTNCYSTIDSKVMWCDDYNGGDSKENVTVATIDTLIGSNAIDITGFTNRKNDIMVPSGVAGFDLPKSEYYVDDSITLRGEGTEGSPFLVADAEEWLFIIAQASMYNNYSGKYIKLEADIDFDGVELEPFEGFAGTLDGNDHAIKNVNMSGSGDIALFCGLGDNATIKNLVIRSSTFEIDSGNWLGTIVCCTKGKNVTISNIYVAKDVEVISNSSHNNSYAGGLIGGVYGSDANVTVDNCIFAGTVEASGKYVAGIIGNVENENIVTISNCLNAGFVTGGNIYVAGIVTTNGETIIENCVNAGIVSANDNATYVAGIVAGINESEITVNDCYSIRNVVDAESGATVTEDGNCDYVIRESLIGNDSLVELEGWTKVDDDFTMPDGAKDYVTETLYEYIEIEYPAALRGTGTKEDPFLVANADEWLLLIDKANKKDNYSGKYVKLEADIDFDGVELVPLSGFAGTFDGAGYAFYNIEMSGDSDVAIFADIVASDVTIENLVVRSSTFEANQWSAALVSSTKSKNLVIRNVFIASDVTIDCKGKKDEGSYAAGIIGGVYVGGKGVGGSYVLVEDCVFAGKVIAGEDSAAGIIASVEQKVAEGVEFNTVIVRNCLNVGTISGKDHVAGIVGGQGMTIENCVNAGIVRSNGKLVGAIAVSNPNTTVEIDGCYYTNGVLLAVGDRGDSLVTYGTNTYVEPSDLTGRNAKAPATFTKRAGDYAVPAGCEGAKNVLFAGLTLLDGASIRISEPSGLRFTAVLGGAYLNTFEGQDITFGIIIAPKDYVDAAGEFTVEALKLNGLSFKEIEALKLENDPDADESYMFSCALAPIQEGNYNRDFAAIAYIKVDGVYYYSEYDEEYNARSISEVAEKAYKDTSLTQSDYYQYLLDDGLTADEAVYSPYTVAQRKVFLRFYNPDGAIDVSFLSYNIRNVEDTSGWLDRPTYEYTNREIYLRDYIKNYDADVVGLQEASWLKATLGTLDWFETLGDENTVAGLTAAGYTCVKGDDLYGGKNSDKKMYNPIYYKTEKYDLVASGTKWLTSTPDVASTIDGADTYKGLNYVVLEERESGQQFVYVNVHLIVRRTNYVHDADGNDTEFYVQELEVIYLREILQELQDAYADLPMFVGGDFNNSYSTINGWFKNSVVGENDWDINSEGTPEETIKLSIARDQAICKAPKCYSCTTDDFTQINPQAIEENWGAIDLWFTSNLDGIVYVYQIIDNKTTTTTGEKYPSDHLPARMYVTIYK